MNGIKGKWWFVTLCLAASVQAPGTAWSEPNHSIEWTEMNVQTDAFVPFFPDTYDPAYGLGRFEGYDTPHTIGLTVRKGFQAPVPLLKGRRGFYGTPETARFVSRVLAH